MSSLVAFLQKNVAVITTDGKLFVGTLEGFDNLTNLILVDAKERIILKGQDSLIEEMGLVVIRGDLVSTVGLIDKDIDESIDWTKVNGEPLLKTKTSIR